MDSSWKGKTSPKKTWKVIRQTFNLSHSKQISSLPVEPILNSASLPVGWCLVSFTSCLLTEIMQQGHNKGPSISRLCFYFYPCTLNKQSWHIAVSVCDYREPALRIQIFKTCDDDGVNVCVASTMFTVPEKHRPQLTGWAAPRLCCPPKVPWFHSFNELPVAGHCRLAAISSSQVSHCSRSHA